MLTLPPGRLRHSVKDGSGYIFTFKQFHVSEPLFGRFANIVADGFDAGVRLGERIAQDMVAVRLTKPFQAVTVAAPGYLEARGTPKSIADLALHDCIGYRMISSETVYAWEWQDKGRDVSVSVNGSVRVTDPSMPANWRC